MMQPSGKKKETSLEVLRRLTREHEWKLLSIWCPTCGLKFLSWTDYCGHLSLCDTTEEPIEERN